MTRRAIQYGWCVSGTVSEVRGEGRYRYGNCSCGRDGVRVTAAGKAYRHTKSAVSREQMTELRRMIMDIEAGR